MPTLTTPDGTRLVYDAYEPTGSRGGGGGGPRAAVLVLHGWSDHAGRWREVGERLRDAGFAAYLLDQRGHGRSGGRRGYLSRFSQLLGDLQAFRRAVRIATDRPQVIVGISFGGLVALRYLETQPGDPVAAAVIVCPWLGLAFRPPAWKRLAGRLLADLWPALRLPLGLDTEHLSRDPAINAAYREDSAVHGVMTPGAWREIKWAQSAVAADGHRIECPVAFLLAGEDRIVDSHLARAFADGLKGAVQVRWYPEMYHEILHDPQREPVLGDIVTFVDAHASPLVTRRHSRP
jgi:alpha-beta hydrolase superfamily lysophospholipase